MLKVARVNGKFKFLPLPIYYFLYFTFTFIAFFIKEAEKLAFKIGFIISKTY
jgi:hypothetical protein